MSLTQFIVVGWLAGGRANTLGMSCIINMQLYYIRDKGGFKGQILRNLLTLRFNLGE